MKKFYDIWVDLNKELMTVEAKNPKDALQKFKKELNKTIDSITEKDLKKKIDTERGIYYYEFNDKNKSYNETSITIYDPLDYSYVNGKKWNQNYASYDLFNWEREEVEHLVTHGLCWCCETIFPKTDIKDNIEKICEDKNLNYDYISDITPICNKCITDEAYMVEYNRTKEIYEEV